MVESAVYSDHYTYHSNKKTNPEFYEKITYPSIDNIKIFGFIDEVRKNSLNNAIVSFNDFSDMEAYLKKQWAGMMYDLLAERTRNDNAKITNRLIDDLTIAAKKSEELIKVLLRTTDAEHAEDKISEIELLAQAESFPKRIDDLFGKVFISDIPGYEIPDIQNYSKWSEFLAATIDFKLITETEHDKEVVYIVYASKQYVELKRRVGDKQEVVNYDEIQSSFEALKQVDKKTRDIILSSIVVPF